MIFRIPVRSVSTIAAGVVPVVLIVLPKRMLAAVLGLLFGLAAGPACTAVISLGDVQFLAPILSVGASGVGSVSVTGGSVLDGAAGLGAFTRMDIGSGTGGDGTLKVDGAGSKVVTTNPVTQLGLSVGSLGKGKVEITNGGSAAVNRFDASQSAGGTSSVKVDGAGSNITSGSVFNVGISGEITNGGVVNAQTSLINASGKLIVTGSGSALNLVTNAAPAFSRAFLGIGSHAQGQLEVLSGGKVLIDARTLPDGSSTGMTLGGGVGNLPPGASFANGNGTLNIDGVGSELRIVGENPASSIGRQGTALLNITGGGKLITENTAAGTTFIGRDPGAVGTANVMGTGSEWQTGRRLLIGADRVAGVNISTGTGTVKVADGGTVSAALPGADAIFVGTNGTLTGGGGTVIGNVTNQGTIAPGNSTGIMNSLGNVALGPVGTLQLQIGGIDLALLQYDQLNAYDNPATIPSEGNVNLDGKVMVSLLGGFNPLAGDFFDVLTANDIIEGAPSYFLPALSAGLRWEHSVVGIGPDREALRFGVVAAAVPEPQTSAMMLIGLGLIGLAARRRAGTKSP